MANVTINHPTNRDNFSCVSVDTGPSEVTYWFSYSTVIAFHTDKTGKLGNREGVRWEVA